MKIDREERLSIRLRQEEVSSLAHCARLAKTNISVRAEQQVLTKELGEFQEILHSMRNQKHLPPEIMHHSFSLLTQKEQTVHQVETKLQHLTALHVQQLKGVAVTKARMEKLQELIATAQRNVRAERETGALEELVEQKSAERKGRCHRLSDLLEEEKIDFSCTSEESAPSVAGAERLTDFLAPSPTVPVQNSAEPMQYLEQSQPRSVTLPSSTADRVAQIKVIHQSAEAQSGVQFVFTDRNGRMLNLQVMQGEGAQIRVHLAAHRGDRGVLWSERDRITQALRHAGIDGRVMLGERFSEEEKI